MIKQPLMSFIYDYGDVSSEQCGLVVHAPMMVIGVPFNAPVSNAPPFQLLDLLNDFSASDSLHEWLGECTEQCWWIVVHVGLLSML